jgi:hypothetical protein
MAPVRRFGLGVAAIVAFNVPASITGAAAASLDEIADYHQSVGPGLSRSLYYRNMDVLTATTATPRSELYTAYGTSTAPSAVPVKFSFLSTPEGFSQPLTGELNALFSLSAVSTSAPLTIGNLFFQLFDTGSLSFTLATPVYRLDSLGNAVGPALDNLLTVSFTDAALAGLLGGTAFNFAGSSATSSLSFTSDFMTFGSDFDFSIAGTGASRSLAIAGLDGRSGSTSLNSFHSASVGQFSASAVPEATSWAMMLAGFSLIGGVLRTRRRERHESLLEIA